MNLPKLLRPQQETARPRLALVRLERQAHLADGWIETPQTMTREERDEARVRVVLATVRVTV